jgi:ankyrin repeat protein
MGRTPLHRAAGAKPEMVELLLSRGADPNAKDSAGFTPLHDAAWMAKNAKNAELLIADGANVNAKADYNGWMPLHEAVYYGEADVVKLLLANKADVNAKTKKGESPTELLGKGLADDDAKKKISEMLLSASGVNK